jgi:hypothetical protein
MSHDGRAMVGNDNDFHAIVEIEHGRSPCAFVCDGTGCESREREQPPGTYAFLGRCSSQVFD